MLNPKSYVLRNLEIFQDILVIGLCLGLLLEMLVLLVSIFVNIFDSLNNPPGFNFKTITSNILFVLILVELFRLLMVYLEARQISVGVAVEIAIVSVLRETIVHGVLETPLPEITAVCAFLAIMGLLLVVCTETPFSAFLLQRQRKGNLPDTMPPPH
ncbi:MAG: phosphate-starvation-inducible PsiE family protein [Cyanobacteria bacterium P01_H01_bin.15]